MEKTMTKTITLYVSNVQGRKTNVSYPYEAKIGSLEELKNAVQYDHVCAKYADKKSKNGHVIPAYRSKNGFMFSDCLPMDCDNSNQNPLQADLSETDWKTPADVQKAFPGVAFYVVYSRNHMKEKDGKAPRPKFHVYFPLKSTLKSLKKYEQLKQVVLAAFPSFDNNAVDGARFFFGVGNPNVEYFAGEKTIDEFLASELAAAGFKLPKKILTGSRNNTLLSIALKALKRFGEKIAMSKFVEAAQKCEEQLPREELEAIWKNAVTFYENKIADENYVLPEEFNKALSSSSEDDEGDEGDDDEGSKKLTTDDIRDALKVLCIKVRLNLITGKNQITGMPKDKSKANAVLTLPTIIRDYFTKTRGITPTRQFIEDSLLNIEDENRFNPVEDMLKNTKHDGQDRFEVLYEILSLKDTENSGENSVENSNTKSGDEESRDSKSSESSESKLNCLNGLNCKAKERVLLIKWLHQCVAMALNVDEDGQEPYGAEGVLVLQAKQGMGKTMFFRKLAVNTDWFAEGVSIDTDNKDTIIQATGRWISELGELDSTLKREQSALKGFITAIRDTYRQPYARVATDKPRRTSFCATVNPEKFLNDETGSRRFWVIHPDSIDVKKLKSLTKDWFRQLWAQVYEQLYLPNPQGFRLDGEEIASLERDNAVKYSKPMAGELEILDKYCWEAPVEAWKWKKALEIKDDIDMRTLSVSTIGKAVTKLMERDPRIKIKKPRNTREYLMPPLYWNGLL